jgi:hypothetical protein
MDFLKERRKYQILSLSRMVFLLFGVFAGRVIFSTEHDVTIPAQSVPKSVMMCVDLRPGKDAHPLALTVGRQSIVESPSALVTEPPVIGLLSQKSKAGRSAAAKVKVPITDNQRQATKMKRPLFAGKKPMTFILSQAKDFHKPFGGQARQP